MKNGTLVSCCLAVLLMSGGCQGERSGTPLTPNVSPVVMKHEFITATEATKPIGASCDVGGASECLSGLCIHASPTGRLHQDYKCSQLCGPGRSPCPTGFACVQGHPSPDGMWCVAEKPKEQKKGEGR